MNMRQLAELAGVSVSTISKAFSGSREVSEAQREHIFALAKANGCFEKYNKTAFEMPIIAVIGPEFQSHYYAQQLSMLEREIRARGALMLTGCYNFDHKAFLDLYTYFAQHAKVKGIISYRDLPRQLQFLPTVVIGKSEHFDSISLSWKNAIAQAVEHLLENGHRKVAFIGERYTTTKRIAFEAEMQKHGLVPMIAETDARFEAAGYEMMQKLLELPAPPTAVLAGYDAIAVGAMKAVYERGLKIPDDISLVGMDDIKSNPYFEVPLTSVTSYNEDLCEIAVNMLFERMQDGDAKKKTVCVSAELVCRDSVGKAKH